VDAPWRRVLHARIARAATHRRHGRYQEAQRELRAALRLARCEAGGDCVELAQAATALGVLLEELGQLAEAEAALRLAVRAYERCCGTTHPALAAPLGALGAVCQLRGDLAEAEHLYERVLVIGRAAIARGNPVS
jgi:tetratricopeptide (TPR) repeat protein